MPQTKKQPDKKWYIGIDPGIANTGFACSGCKTTWTTKTHKSQEKAARMSLILGELIGHSWQCTTAKFGELYYVIEDFFGSYGRDTVQLVGVLITECYPRPTKLVQPAAWVRELFGEKNKGKYKECALRYSKKHGWKPDDQHQADAACLIEWAKKYWHEDNKEK